MEYTFFVEGCPKPQLRPRFSTISGFVRTYDKRETKYYKELVYDTALACFRKNGSILLEGALEVKMTFFLHIPSSWSRLKHEKACKGWILPDVKPDLDNYVKAVLDGIGMKGYPKIIFNNDSQVVRLECLKRYTRFDLIEGVEVTVREYEYEEQTQWNGLDMM